jgi:hypothetical protein
MANRQLTKAELQEVVAPLLTSVRARLVKLSGGDPALLWALRRKHAKELTYDERSPALGQKVCALPSTDLSQHNPEPNRVDLKTSTDPQQ